MHAESLDDSWFSLWGEKEGVLSLESIVSTIVALVVVMWYCRDEG